MQKKLQVWHLKKDGELCFHRLNFSFYILFLKKQFPTHTQNLVENLNYLPTYKCWKT